MLQSIRNNAQGILVWVVVGLIIISFALFGLGSYLSGASKVVAASVNGVDISSTALTRAHQNYLERLRQMFGDQYRPEMFANARVKTEVLNGLITQEVMNQMLAEQGYLASSQQVFDKLQSYKAFQEDGVFSPERYKEVLATQRLNGEAFEYDLSRDIASQQIRTAISASAFLTGKELKNIAALENQKREIGYFDISIKPYQKLIKVSDEQIKAHYEKNSQQYLSTEKVQLEYLELKMDDVARLQEVTDEQIKQQYDSSPDNYKANDDASAEKKISDLRKQIIKGADFAELASQYSDDKGTASQGGDLGYVTRGIDEKFDNTVFALKKGEVSKVIKSSSGYQIIQLEDIRKGDPEERKVRHILVKPERKLQPLAAVKATIKKDLQQQAASKIFFDDADEMNNLSYESPDSLQPVAEALGLKVKISPLMTRRGAAGIFANPKVLSATFSDDVLKQGRNSELLELSDTHLVVLRVKDHQVAKVLPLDKVKTRIKNHLLQEQASVKTSEVTADVLARAENNETVSAILKRYPNIKWNKASLITRKPGKDSKLSQQIRQHAFTMPKPATGNISWSKLNTLGGNQAVVALYKVEEVATAKADNNKLATVLGNADYSSFVDYLKSQADITINQEAIVADEQVN